VTSLDEEGNMLCRVADEIARDVRLSDEALKWALDRYGVRQACELILCCSYFNMLSRFLESTRVQIEDTDLVGKAAQARSPRTPRRAPGEGGEAGEGEGLPPACRDRLGLVAAGL
jgi:hypothetical protein